MKCDYSLIDQKIKPLVNALNGIAGVHCRRACQGHLSISPFVEFDAPVDGAARIALRLRSLWMEKKLSYWWEVSGCFYDGRLEFTLSSPRLRWNRDVLSRILCFWLNRKRIDTDLSILAEEFGNSGHDGDSLRQVIPQEVSAEQQGHDEHNPGQGGLLTKRVFGCAAWTRFGIGSQGAATNLTFKKFYHSVLARLGVCVDSWKIARSFVAVMFLGVALSACGTNRVELQQDGTGLDELLPSPCACNPLPYDTEFYRWGVG